MTEAATGRGAVEALRSEGVTKRYRVSLEVEPGELVSLLGPSGAGESTLMDIIASVVRPDQGDVWVMGHSLRRAPMAVRAALGVVPEAFGQFASGVGYLRHRWAALALTLALALGSASLGMLIGAFARTEQQVVASGSLAMFFPSGLGGARFPLEITGPTFTAVGHLAPTAWAMDAYRAILSRGEGLSGVALPLLVLLGFSVAFSTLAVAQIARRPN